MASAGAAAAAAAAAKRRLEQEEEEEVTMLNLDPSSPYEYKIIRSATGSFKNPARFRAVLEVEAVTGWKVRAPLLWTTVVAWELSGDVVTAKA